MYIILQHLWKFHGKDNYMRINYIVNDMSLQGNGFTALMFACKRGYLDTVFALLNHRANTSLRNIVSPLTAYSDYPSCTL